MVYNFTDDAWSTIVRAVKSGNHPYEVGNTKTVDMGSLGVHTIRVANTTKCSEVTVESKTACGFVLEFADIITEYNMNPAGEYYGTQYDKGTNLGGWPASAMRTYVFIIPFLNASGMALYISPFTYVLIALAGQPPTFVYSS